MTKNTINKVFEKNFEHNIWKIEINTHLDQIAVEHRDPDTTIPFYTIIDFHGNDVSEYHKADQRDWTIDSLQKEYLILKKIGENTPIKEGICVIHIPTTRVVFSTYEYTLLHSHEDYLEVRHKSISSGSSSFLSISDGKLSHHNSEIKTLKNRIQLPYVIETPSFIHQDVDQVWVSKVKSYYIWSYHTENHDKYSLNITLSDKSTPLEEMTILYGMEKKLPQPYFQINQQLFFLSYDKRNIVSYLV